MSRWLRHWEWSVLALSATLGTWLAAPAIGWAVAGLLLALLATGLVVPVRRVLPTVVSLVGLAGALVALDTSLKVRQVESNWSALRENLIELASGELEATLESAVELARDLADSGVAVADAPTALAFKALKRAIPNGGPESGAVLLDGEGRAIVWAGRHRLNPGQGSAELTARITPFYVLLEARRQTGEHVGIGQVVLSADSAVPDRDRTLATLFAKRTGARLEFYSPGRAPATSDVFDYTLPAGSARDTLFAVRTIPPEQGAYKLDLITRRVRLIGLLALGLLVLFAASASLVTRWLGVVGVPILLVFTPAGQQFNALFSPATFYLDSLRFLTASAGHLVVWAALGVVVLVPLGRRGLKHGKFTVGAAVLLAVAIPYVMRYLANGITPPSTQIGIGLWMSWQMSVALAGSVLVLLASLLVGRSHAQKLSPAWTSWAAVLVAAAASIIGLLTWDPISGWPAWFPLLWVPGVLLCIAPASLARTAVTLAIVVGAASAMLTWAEVVGGRLLLADRDAGRLAEGDNLALVGLDRFTGKLAEGRAPVTGAELYGSWRSSLLANDDYPVMLSTWAPGGRELARLDLARLKIGRPLLEALAAEARDSVQIINLPLPQGLHYIGLVPFPDGSVVSVAVGPQSRLIEPVRLARFLRGERRLVAPYTMFLAEPDPGGPLIEPVEWRRAGWTVRGDLSLSPPGGPAQNAPRHLHLSVPLGGFAPLVIRGLLIVSANVFAMGLLWLIGTALSGGASVNPFLRELAQLRSYRSRLTVALAGFFIIPTLGYAAWSLGRLRAEANASRDLLIQETLSDAAGAARQINTLEGDELRDRLANLAMQVNADLLLYDVGALKEASPTVLAELGLLDRYLPPNVYLDLAFQDEPEVTADAFVGGQPTRVGYRNLSGPRSAGPTLAAPRLVDVRNIQQNQEDLVYGLLMATLVGLGAAVLLAGVAAQSLAKPVQSLRKAAVAVGRGESLPPFDPDVPTEFVSVVDAFERMARDVESSQSALESARRRTAVVLKNVATGVVAMNRELRVTIANPRAEELLGVPIPSGARIDGRVGPEWDPVWKWVQEFLDRGADAEAQEFTVNATHIRAQIAAIHGRPGGCVVALDDTTELTRAVRILAWGELARQVAHEIKNPLTPIRLGIQHLKRAYGDAREDFQQTLDRTAQQILAEIERLDAIARAFARFGAPPAEAAPLSHEDLTTIARDTAELYALADGTSVSVDANGSVMATVRRDEVKEVLVNLVENARDAGATEIAITIEGDHEHSTIVVADNGAGIPTDDLPHVFEPQFSTTTSGTGLGLAICKRLVESWGGEIAVESQRSEGTRVRIRLAPVEAHRSE